MDVDEGVDCTENVECSEEVKQLCQEMDSNFHLDTNNSLDREHLLHKMEKLSFSLDNGYSTSDQKQTDTKESRRQIIERCIQSLVHACQCRAANCRRFLPSCQKMKRVIQHAKTCKRKSKEGVCAICKQLVALSCYHAKHCQVVICPVPFCMNIKTKLRHLQLQQRLKQARISKRLVEGMRILGSVPLPGPESSDSSNQLPRALPCTSSHLSVPDTSMKPADALTAVLQVMQQVEADSQPTPDVNEMSQFFPGLSTVQGIQGQPDHPPQSQPEQTGLHQPNQQIGVAGASSAVDTELSVQFLLQIMKLPNAPQEQILDILISNPKLMAGFFKQRREQQQRAQYVQQCFNKLSTDEHSSQ